MAGSDRNHGEGKQESPSNKMGYCGSSRISVAELARSKARQLREQSHYLERLADELDRTSFTRESDQMLFQALANLRFCP